MNIENIFTTEYNTIIPQEYTDGITEQFALLAKLVIVKDNLSSYGYDDTVINYLKTDNVLMESLQLTEEELLMSNAGVCENFIVAAYNAIVKAIEWLIDKIYGFFKWIWDFITGQIKLASLRAEVERIDRASMHWDKAKHDAILQPKNPNNPEPWMLPSFQSCKAGLRAVELLLANVKVLYKPFASLEPMMQKYGTDMLAMIEGTELNRYGRNTDKPGTRFINYVTSELKKSADRVSKIDPLMKLTITTDNANTSPSVTIAPPIFCRKEVRTKADLGIKYKSEFNELTTLKTNCMNHIKEFGGAAEQMHSWLQAMKTFVKDQYMTKADGYDEDNRDIHLAVLTDFLKTMHVIASVTPQVVLYTRAHDAGINEIEEAINLGFQ